MNYLIKGDVGTYNNCLIYVCGNSLELAQQCLERMLNNPTENDKKLIQGAKNLRIEEASEKKCWWEINDD